MDSRTKASVGKTISGLVLAAFLVVGATHVSAQEKADKPDAKLAKQAKITLTQARKIAQAKAAGKIEGEELERENGKLVYSFDIRNEKGTITEVQVDAKDGSIVSIVEEDKAAEAKEKQEERREKNRRKKSLTVLFSS